MAGENFEIYLSQMNKNALSTMVGETFEIYFHLVLTNCKCQLRVVCINYNYGYVFYITNKIKAIQGLSRISPIKTAHPAFFYPASRHYFGIIPYPAKKNQLIPHPATFFHPASRQ